MQYLSEDGKTLCTESITDYTRKAIKKHFATIDLFKGAWTNAEKKKAILDEIEDVDLLIQAVREENPDLLDKDEFDIICHVAFDGKPLTRRERVEGVKKRGYLNKYKGVALQIIEQLMDKYAETGITDIENTDILNISPFTSFGSRSRIIKYFGGLSGYRAMLKDLARELYFVSA